MQKRTLVSIVIPIYKVEQYIENCIKSVVAQTYKNIEVILVDDGTPDNSVSIAEKVLVESGLNYKTIHQENRGQGKARNAGLEVANGEWVYFLDSDDLILPCTIEHMINCIADDIDFVFSKFRGVRSVEEITSDCNLGIAKIYDAKDLQKNFLIRSVIVLAPGTLYRKSFLTDNNLKFEKIPWSEDQHFIWRVLAFMNKAVYLDEPLYQYYKHSGSIMTATKIDKIANSYKVICDLENYYKDNYIGEFLVARWVMGSLNSAVSLSNFGDWKLLFKQIDGKKHLRRLITFPDMKVKILGILGVFSPKMYYWFLTHKK